MNEENKTTKTALGIEENIEAISITLSKDEMEQIDEFFPKGAASGTRYPEAMMKSVNR